jgi:hypothetical protein
MLSHYDPSLGEMLLNGATSATRALAKVHFISVSEGLVLVEL